MKREFELSLPLLIPEILMPLLMALDHCSGGKLAHSSQACHKNIHKNLLQKDLTATIQMKPSVHRDLWSWWACYLQAVSIIRTIATLAFQPPLSQLSSHNLSTQANTPVFHQPPFQAQTILCALGHNFIVKLFSTFV